jgi:hypothetical protein
MHMLNITAKHLAVDKIVLFKEKIIFKLHIPTAIKAN